MHDDSATLPYDEAFALLRERYELLSSEEIRAAERGRQGRLLRDDQDCYAIVDAYRNHRCHTDAFALAMEELGAFLDPEQTICVVDLGAGAGNVAAALGERWPCRTPVKILYAGVEPHAMMRRLGTAFLRSFAPPWMEVRYVDSCRALSIPTADRYLVTLHYLVQQPQIGESDLRDWAELVARMRSIAPTCVVSVSVRSTSAKLQELDCTPALRRAWTDAGLSFDLHATSRRMDRRMPGMDGSGWVLQKARGEDWDNVRIERYTMQPVPARPRA